MRRLVAVASARPAEAGAGSGLAGSASREPARSSLKPGLAAGQANSHPQANTAASDPGIAVRGSGADGACVVIVNWNGRSDTLACLRSVARSRGVGQVIVVDNDSVDGSVAAISREYPETCIVQSGSNIGFAAACNLGARLFVERTELPYLLLLNNDALLEPSTIERLMAALVGQPLLAAAAPKVYYGPPGNDVLWYAGGHIDWKQGSCSHHGFQTRDTGRYDVERDVTFAPAAVLMLKRRAVTTLGLFDERYFMFEEDVDLAIRIAGIGQHIKYVPSAIAWHRVGQSTSRRGDAFTWYHLVRNRLYTMSKHAHWTRYLPFAVYFPALCVWKSAGFFLAGLPDVPRAMVAGLSDYFHKRMGPPARPFDVGRSAEPHPGADMGSAL
jgi:GT2 family glycosyltransferase